MPAPPSPPNPPPRPTSINTALSFIVTRLSDISQLAAQTDRLDALLDALLHTAEGLPGGVRRRVAGGGAGRGGGRLGRWLASQLAGTTNSDGRSSLPAHPAHAGSPARTAAWRCAT